MMYAMEQITVGWREWVALPKLGIKRIKVKGDTGARTSALHAFALDPYQKDGQLRIRFKIHPIQKNETTIVNCETDVFDQRWVTDSSGHRELRFVINTAINLGDIHWPIEITLTNRDTMGFRMLLGRTGMHDRLIVDPRQSYLMT